MVCTGVMFRSKFTMCSFVFLTEIDVEFLRLDVGLVVMLAI